MAYTPEQLRNIAIAKQLSRGRPLRERLALLEAMGVEANFRHLNYGDRSSKGVLQQRPDMGWGPYIPGAKGVRQDIRDFLERADRNIQGFRGSAGQLAQSVQRSAFPGRYDEQESRAKDLLRSRIGGKASSPGFDIAGRLGATGGRAGASQSQGMNPMFAALLQSSNELAAGRMPSSSDLLMALVEQRQVAEQPSPQSQQLAGQVQERAQRGPSGPAGPGITYRGQKLTHQTEGLAGYPAVDIFAKPGTPFTAPENGSVVRQSGHGGTSGNVFGWSEYFQGDSGKKYFITHLGPNRAPVGARLRKGQVVGRVSRWTGGSPHAHVGIHG